MINAVGSIDSNQVLKQYLLFEKEINWVDMFPKGKQAGLQYATEEEENLWSAGTGSLTGLSDTELQFNKLNPLLHGTIFDQIIQEYRLVRTRFMWVNPMNCYSIHRDLSPRIHVPIITNPECYFMFKQGSDAHLQHLSAGTVYWTDTRIPHTFLNCSYEPRLHLIGVPT
jgi:hypothetical protein